MSLLSAIQLNERALKLNTNVVFCLTVVASLASMGTTP